MKLLAVAALALLGDRAAFAGDPPAEVLPAPADAPETDLPRESAIENPLGRRPAITGSAFGGYGEITLNAPSNAPSVVDFRRLVLFFGTTSATGSGSTPKSSSSTPSRRSATRAKPRSSKVISMAYSASTSTCAAASC